MAPIVSSIEIARRPEDVFAYVTDPSRLGIDGPVRGIVKGSIEPLDDGARSRVTIELDLEGHGIGKLLVPLVVHRQAKGELPRNAQNLKERLEGGAG